MGSRSFTRIVIRAALALAITALTFVGAEIGFRLWKFQSTRMRAMWVTDPDLVYALNPDAPDSPGGFRGGLRATAAGERLVVCLGGSTTYGFDVAASDAWPAALEDALEDAGCPAVVANGGVSGYGSRQLLLRYRRDIRPMRPRVLVIYSLWNRTGVLVDNDQFVPAIIPRNGDSALRRLLAFGGAQSLLVRRVVTRLHLLDRDRAWTSDPHHAEFERDIHALVTDAIKDGMAVILIGPPALYHVDLTSSEVAIYSAHSVRSKGDYAERIAEHERKISTLRSIASETGAWFVDLQSIFKKRGDDRVGLFLDEMHLSVDGNRFVAQQLRLVVQTLAGCNERSGGQAEVLRNGLSHPGPAHVTH